MSTIVPGENMPDMSNQGDDTQGAGILPDQSPLYVSSSTCEAEELKSIPDTLKVTLKGTFDSKIRVEEVMSIVTAWLVENSMVNAIANATDDGTINLENSPKANLIFDFTDKSFSTDTVDPSMYGFKEMLIEACKSKQVVSMVTFAVDPSLFSRMLRQIQGELLEFGIFVDHFPKIEIAVDYVKSMTKPKH